MRAITLQAFGPRSERPGSDSLPASTVIVSMRVMHLRRCRNLLAVLLLVLSPAASHGAFRAGAHVVDISPTNCPVRVNAMFTERTATSVADPLFAKALAFDDGTNRLVLCVVDTCMVPRDLIDRAKAEASAATGVAVERMLVSATHTHSAPSAMGCLGSRVDPGYASWLPPRIAADMEQSDVSIFAAQVQANELRSRMDMTDIVNRRRMRHAHMVNITPRIMTEGMRAGYRKVDAISQRVIDVVRQSRRIRATTPAGTDITAELNPGYRWDKTSGLITPEKWGNLPGGEVFTTPGSVNGTFVIDGVVGDWLCDRYGLLTAAPLTVTIRDSRLTGAHSTNQALRDDFWAYTHTDENSDRVGEFAIGTNIQLNAIIGHILQDEKFPGIHIAFGNPYGAHTGADWYSSTHIDVVGANFDIWVDDEQIMDHGRFLI